LLIGLASIIVLGISAQWLAWQLKIPPILFLLVFGLVAGPVTGWLNPDLLMGDLLVPIVSISVALILFEGGLSLRLVELRAIGRVVINLITFGVLVTWALITILAVVLLHFNLEIAVLLGAILVVTGPTVIIPMLRHVRPTGKVNSILKWEGIMIDPVGALLAVVVFEAILAGGFQQASAVALASVLKTLLLGSLVGVVSAWILILLLKRYWIPDFLHESVTFMLVIGAFVVSNIFQKESGLFAVTLMGIVVANQKRVTVRHIVEFKENLRVMLISGLFILLGARLQLDHLNRLGVGSVVFLVLVIILVRPVSVLISTWKSELKWQEKVFIASMAPRGIVAAAIAAIFALRLSAAGYPQAEYLETITFMVIIGTVALYSITASPIARALGLARANPQGLLMIGAHSWARTIAKALKKEKFKVTMVDTNPSNIAAARREGLPAYHGSILSEHIFDEISLEDIGRLLALTSNDEANSLAVLQFIKIFERAEVYQLPFSVDDSRKGETAPHQHLHGRFLFGTECTYNQLTRRFAAGGRIESVILSNNFDYEDFIAQHGDTVTPLFLITEAAKLVVFTKIDPPTPKPGQTLLFLRDAERSPA